MVVDDRWAFFFPLVDFFEPGVECFLVSGEGEDDVDVAGIIGWVDGGVADGDVSWELWEFTEGDDFVANVF